MSNPSNSDLEEEFAQAARQMRVCFDDLEPWVGDQRTPETVPPNGLLAKANGCKANGSRACDPEKLLSTPPKETNNCLD